MNALNVGFSAFRESYLSSGGAESQIRTFETFWARRLRYELNWAFFENDAYRDIHSWSKKMRSDYGLYKYIRGIYNPAFRLGRFWQGHLMGGQLDMAASDENSALPILTDNDKLRLALAKLWKDSNWQFKKDLYTLRGVVLGDVGLRVMDDPVHQRVTLDVLHPISIQDIKLDTLGNVKAYLLYEYREDPRPGKSSNAPAVIYTERAERDGQDVVYQTYLNGEPFAWGDQPAEWNESYGFIPMVLVQHMNMGLDWGWGEFHAGLPKFREADDLASKLDDQIRKMVDAPWLFSGVDKPKTKVQISGSDPSITQPEPGREEIPVLYGPAGSSAMPLVAPLDINATTAHIATILQELERDYPELKTDLMNATAGISGRAIRTARQSTETKAQGMRATYDDGLVRAQKMAIAIGGYRGYDGYQGFDLDSFQAGNLEHSIDKRPVFANDPMDDYELDLQFWQTAVQAKNAGMPLDVFLMNEGWSEEDIKAIKDSPQYQMTAVNLQMQQATLAQQKMMGGGG